jgi:hypothetical protein
VIHYPESPVFPEKAIGHIDTNGIAFPRHVPISSCNGRAVATRVHGSEVNSGRRPEIELLCEERHFFKEPFAMDFKDTLYAGTVALPDPVDNNPYPHYIRLINPKYSSRLMPAVRILFLIISTSISSYSGITTALLAPGHVRI